jgi:hypothetical protein
MQKLCIALLIFAALLTPAQQPASSNPASSGKLSIPAQLTKTVRADKVRAGDPVKFRTLEAVLVSPGLVMPANTSLHGRVLVASPKQDGKNSWLALVVERAEWKQHSLPLHAFVVAQISISATNNQPAYTRIQGNTTPPQHLGRRSAGGGVTSDPSFSSIIKSPGDATETGQNESVPKYPALDNVDILRDKDGTTYLLSSKTNVKLPAGVLLMLKNEPVETSQPADAKVATSASSTGQQN